MSRFVLFLLCSLLPYIRIFAQNSHPCVEASYQYRESGLKIRWVFTDYLTWKEAVRNGINIHRLELDENLNVVESKAIATLLKPESLAEMKQRFGPTNKAAAIAAQMLYGKSTVQNTENFAAFLKHKKTEQEVVHSTAMYSAALDFEVARSIALGITDDVAAGKNYIYKMIINNGTCDTVYLPVNTHAYEKQAPFSGKVTGSPAERAAILNWSAAQYGIVGYYVEKSLAGKNDFKRLNKEPLVLIENELNKNTLQYTDPLNKNGVPFDYRIVGTDAFGEETTPSEIVTVTARDVTPPTPPVLQIKPGDHGSLHLMWNTPRNNTGDLLGYHVLRGTSIDGPYQRISTALLGKTTTSFHDKTPDPVNPNFYRVEASDTSGNMSQSLPVVGRLTDTIAPQCPGIAQYTRVSEGLVDLHWNTPSDKDVLAYRVFFSNSLQHEFTLATSTLLNDTFFTHHINLNTLTSKIYYRVQAVDFHYNESANCPVIEVVRKDTIKPTNALLKQVRAKNAALLVEWVPSTSTDADRVLVKRRQSKDAEWIVVFTASNLTDSLFEDSSIVFNQRYEYAICTVDMNGNQSDLSMPFAAIHHQQKQLKAIENLHLVQQNKQRFLKWSGRLNEGDVFLIYYSPDNGKTATVIGRQKDLLYEIPAKWLSGSHAFSVCMMNATGLKSAFSEWVSVKE